jgi:hypothetical protein
MTALSAWLEVVDTEIGYRFTRRFTASPISIGRALINNVCLQHPDIADRHGEISIGPRFARFRSRAWIKKSWIDGRRVRRGEFVKLAQESVLALGPFRMTLRFQVRDRQYERQHKVTPLALVRLPEWDGAWEVEQIREPYSAIETSPRAVSHVVPPRPYAGQKAYVTSPVGGQENPAR